jgi:hypothetical protein|eukprot:COSAG01_NODE_3526_length_5971_cov_13.245305_5_plen_55_part_00
MIMSVYYKSQTHHILAGIELCSIRRPAGMPRPVAGATPIQPHRLLNYMHRAVAK